MVKTENAKRKRRTRPLYFSAKISDYQFRKVLWHFVLDDTAAQAARHINLSVNSISAIYGKLRKFFFEVGLFTDIYNGGDPKQGTGFEDEEEFEYRLIGFHLKRDAAKRGLHSPPDGPDYHFAESHWRFHFDILNEGRPNDAIHMMMFGHLLEIIRCCGPVGLPPMRRREGLQIVLQQMDRRILWMERNLQSFANRKTRAALKSIRSA